MDKHALPLLLLFVAACSQPVEKPVATKPAAPAPKLAPAAKPSTVSGPKLMPVDEATSDPTLVSFRNTLIDAIEHQDDKTLAQLVDPKVRTSFGDDCPECPLPPAGDGGQRPAEGRDSKPLIRPSATFSPLRGEKALALEHALALGGTFQKGSDVPRFWAPYVYSAWPESHDAFTEVAVIANDVPLHQSNDAASPSIATLQYDILTTLDHDQAAPMRHVRTADKREGWVETQFVRSPIDYRAGLVKKNGGWKIEAFVAGD
jgi:hypothetical protein